MPACRRSQRDHPERRSLGWRAGYRGCKGNDRERADQYRRRHVHDPQALHSHPRAKRSDHRDEHHPPGRGPDEHPGGQERGTGRIPTGHAEADEQGREGQDRHRVGEGEAEHREIGTREPGASGGRIRCNGLARDGTERSPGKPQQEGPAHDTQDAPSVQQQVGDGRQPECGDGPVRRIGGGHPETRREPDEPALGERPADAQQADRPDGGRDRETEDGAPCEEGRIHGWV